MANACENCKYWFEEEHLYGFCRRNAPVIIPKYFTFSSKNKKVIDSSFSATWFPSTACGDWCGEWMLRKNEIEK